MPETILTQIFTVGDEIFRAGDRGQNAYIIERGKVEVSIVQDGEKQVLAELGEGEMFGEMSMIDDAPRSATVTAVEDTEVISIPRPHFLKPLTAADPMIRLLLSITMERLRSAQRQYRADLKANGNSPSVDEIRNLAFQRIRGEREMRTGLEDQQFQLHYQPIVSLKSGCIAGFEALMRWRKSDGTYCPPVEFIPLAEDTGLIVELGRLALEVALQDQIRFADRFKSVFPDRPQPFMSINVSGLQFSQLSEIDLIADIIENSGVDPTNIKLEMTETLLVENPEHAAEALKKIKKLGISIAIDDFGTGYSSLSYLHQFPFDTLKIDRSFVMNMETEKGRRIVNSIAQLALAMDMRIVAEGIEEQSQMTALHDLDCHYGQGYYMARPAAAEDTLSLIDSGKTWTWPGMSAQFDFMKTTGEP